MKEPLKTTTLTKAHTFLKDIVQKEISYALSDYAFIEKINGEFLSQESTQGKSDQSDYVKHIIGEEVGIPYPIKFDLSSRVLSKKLLALSKVDLLKAFYNYFLPHKLVQTVIGDVNKELKKSNALYDILEQLVDKDAQSKAWDIKDNNLKNPTYSLTQFGALHLLTKIGALQQSSLKK